jgi:hypothetical protein
MRRAIGSMVSLALLALTPAFAHHSKANFLNETIVLQGEVVDFRWANPHAIFSMSVSDASGKATVWQVEVAATPQLVRSGWTESSLLPGDRVTVRAQPDRNRARPFAAMQSVLKEDGTVLSVTPADVAADASRPRAPSVLGVWQPARRRQGGAGIAPGAADEPPLSLPLTPQGLEAARKYDVRDNPRLQCVPFTSPENLGTPYLHTIERDGDNILLRTEYMEITRVVYIDGRGPPPGEPSLQGHSVGHWEGDVLVVETTAFADQPWGVARGIPSGPGKRVVERYRLTDSGETLTVDFTIEDPEYLTAPFAGSELWRYAPKLKLVPNKCDVEVAHKYLGSD